MICLQDIDISRVNVEIKQTSPLLKDSKIVRGRFL